ncbi:DUF4132 domain-containing protein [Winogradskya humida]|uniref:DUF4132 domain-containing protein n=1 Tax=Winogradskya humida TaxID=113566 RepID=A0ABQ4A0U4_9ACTN|nr:DUF4132 domain-containing protein [Actinoplanes humidus]GIE24466.1 hypothetical protein Ahu01nite_075680 [Actinoplanes humidus]
MPFEIPADWLRCVADLRPIDPRPNVLSRYADWLSRTTSLGLRPEGARALDFLTGSGGSATPRGVAEVAIATGGPNGTISLSLDILVDAWLDLGGLPFAAAAVAELAGLGPFTSEAIYLAEHLRPRLVHAGPALIGQVVAELAPRRDNPAARLVASYLVPERTDWIDEDCRDLPHWERTELSRLLLFSVRSVERLRHVGRHTLAGDTYLYSKELFGTVLRNVGPAAAAALMSEDCRHLCSELRSGWRGYADETVRLLELCPDEETVRLLLEAAVGEGHAVTRFDLLVSSSTVLIRHPLLCAHVLADLRLSIPGLATDLLAAVVTRNGRTDWSPLPPAARDKVEKLRAGRVTTVGAGLSGLMAAQTKGEWPAVRSAVEGRAIVKFLAALPGDHAFAVLAEQRERDYVLPALLAAIRRDPERAARVLPAGDPLLPVDTVPDPGGELPEGFAEVPGRTPRLPTWLVVQRLPVLETATGALPPIAAHRLCALIARSTPDKAHPALVTARSALDPVSAARFAWAIFERWREFQYADGSRFPMTALGHLGTDTTADDLAAQLPVWSVEASARVPAVLDALASIGTDTAITHLHRTVTKARTKGLRNHAGKRLDKVAAVRGLSREQLDDRIVPDLGLDRRGSTTLEVGDELYTVTVDESLSPVLRNASGVVLNRLPRRHPGFERLKKELTTIGADRIRALDDAMVAGRGWALPDFLAFLVRHPLMGVLTRRLVWISSAGVAFRVAEDGSLADVSDQAVVLPGDAVIRVAHPLELDVATWSDIFADYVIVQPFQQVQREVYEAEPYEPYLDRDFPRRRLYALAARGWRFGEGHTSLSRAVLGGETIHLELYDDWDPLRSEPDDLGRLRAVRTDPSNPIAVSETIRAVRYLTR